MLNADSQVARDRQDYMNFFGRLERRLSMSNSPTGRPVASVSASLMIPYLPVPAAPPATLLAQV